MTQFCSHIRKCLNQQDPGVAVRWQMLNLCLASMKKDALILSRLPFSTQGRTYLKENFLLDVHGAVYCGDCVVWATRMSKLRKQHQKGRRPNCSRENYIEGCACYRPMYSDVLIPPDFDRESLCHRFRFYLEYIERTGVSSIEHIPNDPLTSGIHHSVRGQDLEYAGDQEQNKSAENGQHPKTRCFTVWNPFPVRSRKPPQAAVNVPFRVSKTPAIPNG